MTSGILVAYLVGLAFNGIEGWRWMLGLGCVPALALAFGMWRMPQSPRWLVMHGDDFKARAVLAKIHSWSSADRHVRHSWASASVAVDALAAAGTSRSPSRLTSVVMRRTL